jgi:FtsP/CotA-like multicopper oxidase with cupredoxin domain
VNGSVRLHLVVHRGEVVRYYLTNVSTARPYNIAFGTLPVKVIGSDGGHFARPRWASSVAIAPAERYTVDVRFPLTGTLVLTNRILALAHMTGTLYPEVDTLAIIDVLPPAATPDYSAAFARLDEDHAAAVDLGRYAGVDWPVDHQLRLVMHVRDLPPILASFFTGVSVPVDWNDGMGMMNWILTPHEITWALRDPTTGAENLGLHWHFRQGERAVVRIANDATMPHAMDHVIHLHGQRLLVLRRNGAAVADRSWKDTVLIPAGETVDLLLDLANPGRWLLHCHIAEHMGAGMMTVLTVDPTSSASSAAEPTPSR